MRAQTSDHRPSCAKGAISPLICWHLATLSQRLVHDRYGLLIVRWAPKCKVYHMLDRSFSRHQPSTPCSVVNGSYEGSKAARSFASMSSPYPTITTFFHWHAQPYRTWPSAEGHKNPNLFSNSAQTAAPPSHPSATHGRATRMTRDLFHSSTASGLQKNLLPATRAEAEDAATPCGMRLPARECRKPKFFGNFSFSAAPPSHPTATHGCARRMTSDLFRSSTASGLQKSRRPAARAEADDAATPCGMRATAHACRKANYFGELSLFAAPPSHPAAAHGCATRMVRDLFHSSTAFNPAKGWAATHGIATMTPDIALMSSNIAPLSSDNDPMSRDNGSVLRSKWEVLCSMRVMLHSMGSLSRSMTSMLRDMLPLLHDIVTMLRSKGTMLRVIVPVLCVTGGVPSRWQRGFLPMLMGASARTVRPALRQVWWCSGRGPPLKDHLARGPPRSPSPPIGTVQAGTSRYAHAPPPPRPGGTRACSA